jgi:DNA (cytosine-5)-methyltransferase 1
MITVGSLFSGIGGIEYGLERTGGFRCIWQCETDPYCRRVLQEHWPEVPKYGDIRTLSAVGLPGLVAPDMLVGGFPCQDISTAGKRAGITGKRSGLWKEFYRLICELRPRYVLVENTAALLNWGLDTVLSDLAEGGYDAEWQSIPAAAFGAPHIRERAFIVAYPTSQQDRRVCESRIQPDTLTGYQDVEDSPGRREWQYIFPRTSQRPQRFIEQSSWWASEPRLGRVVYGVPNRVDRLKGLGNAVVPQCATYIGVCILASIRE